MVGEQTTPSIPPEWRDNTPTDGFAYFEDDQNCVILSTDDFTLSSATWWPSPKRLMVYAEKIHIAGNLKLPGRKLSLFCNTMTLGQRNTTIDVTGGNGKDGVPDTTTNDDANGSPGGELIIYIENLTSDLIPDSSKDGEPGLYLLARGGNGGAGPANTKSDVNGGKGGKGGKAGAGGK